MSTPHNSYPELPVIPYVKTATTEAADILNNFMFHPEVRRAAYAIAYNESAGFKSGVNENYSGMQADTGRWQPDGLFAITATTVVTDSTGASRRFLCFDNAMDCLYMLCFKIDAKGLYIGAEGIADVDALAVAYWRKWVTGDSNAVMPEAELKGFRRLYEKAKEVIG